MAAKIASVLACGSDHVSAIEAGAPLAANRATIDAALLSQLMSPASIGNDALAYLINTYRRAHQSGKRRRFDVQCLSPGSTAGCTRLRGVAVLDGPGRLWLCSRLLGALVC